jgi:Tfp pilus assembly protein PilN
MNNLGITMAAASATHSDRTTKQNQAMILIATISLVASALIAGWGFVRDRSEERERVAMLKQLTESIEASRKASEKLQRAMDVSLREVVDTQRAVAAEIKATRQTAAKKGKK